MKNNRFVLSVLCLGMAFCMMFTAVGCDSSVSAVTVDLMDGVTANKVKGNPLDDRFKNTGTEFALDIFKMSYNESNGENLLVSPVSVSLALSMAANGADGGTFEELENFLGRGITLEELNKYYRTYLSTLPNSDKTTLNIANSVWFKDTKRFEVGQSFLQTNADWYGADIFKAPFDRSTVKDINSWVSENTEGLIDKMVDEIDEKTLMYLINAVSFEGEWLEKYTDEAVSNGTFTTASREFQTAEYMFSNESIYLDDGKATGFMKYYSGGNYAFAALLPNADVGIDDYVNGLTADGVTEMLSDRNDRYSVTAYLPKFSYSYEICLNNSLKAAGIPTAFDPDKANFKKLGKADGNIYISEVLHKTAITVDQAGTVASASTKVSMTDKMSVMPTKTVRLDRPFVYMIIDVAHKMPIFIGTVMTVE